MKTLIINIITRLSTLFGMTSEEFVPQLISAILEAFPNVQPANSVSKRNALINSFMDDAQIYVLKPNGTCIFIPGGTDNMAMSTFLPPAKEIFDKCTQLKIEEGTTKIQANALAWCENIEEVILPETVTEIQEDAFLYTSLTHLFIPDSVKNLGYGFCRFCSALSEVHLPEHITKIPYLAFDGCKTLSNINIPDSVNSIEKGAFCGCDKLPEETKQKIMSIGGPEAFTC